MLDKNLIIFENETINKGITKLTLNGQGAVIVISKKYKALGIISDDEIRNAYLNKINTNLSCTEIYNPNFFYISQNSFKDISELINKYKVIPVLKNGILVNIISRTLSESTPIAKPKIYEACKLYVNNCLNSTWVSSQGSYVDKFENYFKDFTGLKNVTSVINGTSAIELALAAFNIGSGDEVIVPNFTFGGSINPIINQGATPVIVEVNKDTWLLNFDLLKTAITKKTKAIICVDIYGNPENVNLLRQLIPKNIKIIQDSAESLSSTFNNKHTGVFADAVTFSFYANKLITTGEGGIVCFKNKKYFNIAKLIKNHGMNSSKKYYHILPGKNLRMTNLSAAIGCGQMENINKIIEERNFIFKNYRDKLTNYITEPKINKSATQGPWLFTGVLDKIKSKKLITYLRTKNIEANPLFYPLNIQPAYSKYKYIYKFKNSHEIHKYGISLPTFNDILNNEQNNIIDLIKKFFDDYKKL